MPITNGKNNPNEFLGEDGENYFHMKERIIQMGPINEILKNHDLVGQIIAYNGDRHFFAAFIDIINEALSNGKIWPEDLEVFNSGKVADAIVNMEQTAKIYGERDAYPAEVWDKLNYLSLLRDEKSLTASFTHPAILDALCGNGSDELIQWANNPSIPSSVIATISYELLQKGNIEALNNFLDKRSFSSKKYSSSNKPNGFSFQEENKKQR